MQQYIVFLLSSLLFCWFSLAGVLPVPRGDEPNLGSDFALDNTLEKPAPPDILSVTVVTTIVTTQLSIATLTTTTMTTAVVTVIEPASDILDDSVAVATTPDASSGDRTVVPVMTPSPLAERDSADSTTTTFATITSPASSSASIFNTDKCDDMYCNSEGGLVCIYWAGVTSWDVSLGPMPGEIPTVVGTCSYSTESSSPLLEAVVAALAGVHTSMTDEEMV